MQLRVNRNLKRREGDCKAMSQPTHVARPEEVGGETTDGGPRSVDSITLMSGRRELIIRHGTETYRLRVTASNKLILTK